jgi:hypothetical protein
MQLAALAAVMFYFWNDLRDLTVNSWRAVLRRKLDDHYFRLSVWIILATLPIGLAGLALAGVLNACGSPLRTLSVIGWACVVMAVLLAFAEVYARHKRTITQASMVDALFVGVAQVGALIPRCLPLGLDPDRCACARFPARRGGSLLVSPWPAGNRVGGAEGTMGAPQGPPRRARLVRSRAWPFDRFDLGVLCDLEPDADPGAVHCLAIRDLPRVARRHSARRRGDGVAHLTRGHGLAPGSEFAVTRSNGLIRRRVS